MSKHPTGSTASEVEGVVTGLRERAEPVGHGGRTRIERVVTFELVCPDERPQVVMRADKFEGALFNGDRVTIWVSPSRRSGATIHTVALVNESRSCPFGAASPRRRWPLSLWLGTATLTCVVGAVAVLRFAGIPLV